MKFLLISSILFVVLVASSVAEHSPEEKMKNIKDCQEQEKATDEDLQAFRTHKLTPKSACLAACIYEKSGGMKDGKIDAETIKTNVGKEKGENEKFGKAVENCQTVANAAADRCEVASQFLECMKKGHEAESSN